jgi:hypothetical protein
MILAFVATRIAAQAHADFSGRWMLVAPSPAPANAVRVLVVDWQVMQPSVRGEPRPLVYLHITIRREGAAGVTTDTYPFGLTGAVMGAPIDRGDRRATWRGDTLTLLTRRDGWGGSHTGDWSERRESWSLDPDGRLRVEIETEARDRAPRRTVLHYRRE